MKSSSTFLYLFSSLIFMYSCSDETSLVSEETNDQLTTITEVFYLNNAPQGSTTVFTVSDNVNSEINYEGGSDAIQYFTNGLMTSAEYLNAQAVMTGRTTFNYDAMGKLTSYSYYEIESAVTTLMYTTDFEYVANQINSTRTYFNTDGTIASTDITNIFTVDANGLITRFDYVAGNAYWEATYIDNNIATIEVNGYGNNDGTGSFTYTSELASDAYQKEKYRFGTQWKTNIMLYNQVGGFSFKQLAETGENYLSSYTFSDLNGQPTVTLNVDYEFDDEGRLIQQTKNKVFFGVAHDRILTYLYE